MLMVEFRQETYESSMLILVLHVDTRRQETGDGRKDGRTDGRTDLDRLSQGNMD